MANCCGNCAWSDYDDFGYLVCANYDSEYVADFVDEAHTCCEWKEKSDADD